MAATRLQGWIDRFAERHDGITTGSLDDARGVVRIEAGDRSWAEIDVPWPPLPPEPSGDVLRALVDHVSAARRLGLLLVRKGGYAVGVLDPQGLTQTKVGSRHVQGRTKAGGWSQQRYARRRAQQARVAYEAASDVTARILLPVVETLDGLVPGGDRQAVAAVLADPRLRRLDGLPRGRFLDVPDPRRAVLDKAAVDCRAVLVHVRDVTR